MQAFDYILAGNVKEVVSLLIPRWKRAPYGGTDLWCS
jgi:hypothetical protein